MSKKYDDVVSEILQTGGQAKGNADVEAQRSQHTDTPTDSTEQNNESVSENQDVPSGTQQDQPGAEQPGADSQDPAASELAAVTAGAAENAQPGDGNATGEPESASDSGTGEADTDNTGTGDGDGEGEPNDDAPADTGTGDEENVDDGFNLDDGDDGVDPDEDVSEDDIDASSEESSDDSSPEDGGEKGSEESSSESSEENAGQESSEGDGTDSSAGSEENSDNGEVESEADTPAEPEAEKPQDEGTGEPEGGGETPQFDESIPEAGEIDEDADPIFDSDGTSVEREQAKEVADTEDPTAKATEVITEAKEISDRLGDLAQQIVDQYGPEGKDPETEDAEVEQDVEAVLAKENLKPLHRHLRDSLFGSLEATLGLRYESLEGQSVYRLATQKVLTDALEHLKRLGANKDRSFMKLEAKIESLHNHLETGLEMTKSVSVPGDNVDTLVTNGSLNLDNFVYASQIQTVTRELSSWIGSMLAQYLKNAADGKRSSVMPFRPSVLRDDPKLVEPWRTALELATRDIGPIWPGDRALVCVSIPGTETYSVRLKSNPQRTKVSETYQVAELDTSALKNLVNELKIAADALRSMLKVVTVLTNSTQNFLSWTQEATEDELELVNFAELLPMAYSPAISITGYLDDFVWDLVTFLEFIFQGELRGAKPTE